VETAIAEEVRQFREHGDRAAAESLARRAFRLALRTASAIVGTREDAADIAQDVTADVLSSLSKLRDPSAFDAWAHRICVRHAMRALRRRRRTVAVETPLGLLEQPDEPASPEVPDHAALLAARAALATGLAALPARQRLALVLRYVHDLSDAEIAEALGCRLGTAHSLLSRGRAALRRDPKIAELSPATSGGPG
jgi:RNA polymerase sigma factor (sigma-70 family)